MYGAPRGDADAQSDTLDVGLLLVLQNGECGWRQLDPRGGCGDHRSLLVEVIAGGEGGSRRGVAVGEELRRPTIWLLTRAEPGSLAGVGVEGVLHEVRPGRTCVETGGDQLGPQEHRGQRDQRSRYRPAAAAAEEMQVWQ